MVGMRRRELLIGLPLALALACGGKARDASDESSGVRIEYVPIAIRWVRRHLTDKSDDASREAARKLAEDILSRMQGSSESLDAIAEAAIREGLGPKALSDPKRRKAVSLPPSQAGDADLPEDAKEALAAFARRAQPGDVVDSALGTGPVLVVARAVRAE